MYDRPLNLSEVRQNYDSALANSPPVAKDIAVYVNEDGEVGSPSDAYTQFYEYDDQAVYAFNMTVICLDVVDADDDENYPTFNPATSSQPTVFVSGLPLKGTLADLNGTDIDSVPHTVLYNEHYNELVGCGFNVLYRPLEDEYSEDVVYTSFTYSANDSQTMRTSVVPGVVDIHVIPTNDPPIPENITTEVSSGLNNIIFLNGTDIDSPTGDRITGAAIREEPTQGILYEVYPNGSASSTVVKERQPLWGQYVSYSYTGNLSSGSEFNASTWSGLLGEDSFTFFVIDASDTFSAPGKATLKILSGITALSPMSVGNSSWRCIEDENNTVFLFAEDFHGSRELMFVISSTPPHGSLYSNAHTILNVGDKIEATQSSHFKMASVIYRPDRDFFNSPYTTYQDGESENEMRFFVEEKNNSGHHSAEGVQYLEVTNTNDPTWLSCPIQQYNVEAIGATTYDTAGELTMSDRVYLSGFTVDDPDQGIDVIKVSVAADHGLLSLNPTHVHKLDFNSFTYCLQNNWGCQGSGSGDKSLVFIGEPDDVELALNGMKYQTYNSGVIDHVMFTIYDGDYGDQCSMGDTNISSNSSCWQVSCSINITANN
ncbi:unnamed protein product, partial [Discosporangium mesarthrocarpum]